jgi:urea ABC transporter ATP-binding protein UrtE
MIEASQVDAGYGKIPILADISFRVEPGEFLGILGHNGMGKTTLLKTLAGLLPATAGRISMAGQDITGLPPHLRARKGMGYVPQGRGIFPGLTVLENLQFAEAALNVKKNSAVETIVREFPRLKALLDRRGGALSGGEQQLLALARALIRMPGILLLDEPTEGIQPSIIEEIIDKLKDLRARHGLTILLVEQNLDFIKSLSDRVLLIHKGAIAKELLPSELSESAALGNFSSFE